MTRRTAPQSEAPVQLVRGQDGHLTVAGVGLWLIRNDRDLWRAVPSREAAGEWLRDVGLLGIDFQRLRDLRAAVLAHSAITPPPRYEPDDTAGRPAAELRRLSAGLHRTVEGDYEVRRLPPGQRTVTEHWEVLPLINGQPQKRIMRIYVRSLRWAAIRITIERGGTAPPAPAAPPKHPRRRRERGRPKGVMNAAS